MSKRCGVTLIDARLETRKEAGGVETRGSATATDTTSQQLTTDTFSPHGFVHPGTATAQPLPDKRVWLIKYGCGMRRYDGYIQDVHENGGAQTRVVGTITTHNVE
jgi:hypothetical protein